MWHFFFSPQSTVQYLASVRALLSEKEYQEMEKLVEEFKASKKGLGGGGGGEGGGCC